MLDVILYAATIIATLWIAAGVFLLGFVAFFYLVEIEKGE